MQQHPVRVLIVDDFKPFRAWLSSKIKKADGFEVIGEAADGVEAVRMATRSAPDLILLDIGLPNTNGIQLGKQLRCIVPCAQIIFVTEHSEREIVHHASAHAEGYVLKQDVECDLLPAMHAIAQGLRGFLSRGLKPTEADTSNLRSAISSA
jgi:DNA-binding NarL/FixJ family response regulator